MADLTELQRLAEGATPGPGESQYTHPRDSNNWQANAAFAAHFDADTAKKLIAVATAAELAKVALEMGEPDDTWSIEWRALAALRAALEELK